VKSIVEQYIDKFEMRERDLLMRLLGYQKIIDYDPHSDMSNVEYLQKYLLAHSAYI
jgi:hypothetical protein